jgi:hypothetical protein
VEVEAWSKAVQIPAMWSGGDGGVGRKGIYRVGERRRRGEVVSLWCGGGRESSIQTTEEGSEGMRARDYSNFGDDADGDEEAEELGEDDDDDDTEVATTTKGKSHREALRKKKLLVLSRGLPDLSIGGSRPRSPPARPPTGRRKGPELM